MNCPFCKNKLYRIPMSESSVEELHCISGFIGEFRHNYTYLPSKEILSINCEDYNYEVKSFKNKSIIKRIEHKPIREIIVSAIQTREFDFKINMDNISIDKLKLYLLLSD